MPIAVSLAVLALAYLSGAIPFGVVFGRLFRGADLRKVGSGSTGTTNALRTFGIKISVLVLIGDVLKGALPVMLARWFDGSPWVVGAVAVLTVVGHCWSPFIEFDGGFWVGCAFAEKMMQKVAREKKIRFMK